MKSIDNLIKNVLFSENEISKRVKELGLEISKDYEDENDELILVGILKGAVIFLADLARAITIPAKIDFISVSSYGASASSTGEVRMIKDLDYSVEGKNILVIEDIIDSGHTLAYLADNLKKRGAKSVKICAFLDKAERRVKDVPVDYLGFQIPDEFVVGYGLDYNEIGRNHPSIVVLKEEVYM